MFLLLFLFVLAAGGIHARATGPRTRERLSEMMLVYALVGYFGLLMLGLSAYTLLAPERFAASHGWRVSNENPFLAFSGVAYGGMAVIALLAAWLRGRYLIGPTVCWSIFFLGATWIHLADYSERGREITFSLFLKVFSSHGLMSVVMIALLLVHVSAFRMSRSLRDLRNAGRRA